MCMFTKPFVPKEIAKIIAKFNQNKSPGQDDIGNMIVKSSYWNIKAFIYLYQLVIENGVVPEQLKIAKVIPIYKKKDVEYW